MENEYINSDITFITNEEGNKLKNRFNNLIKDSKEFLSLSGYFYLSGFHQIYKSLDHVDKIKILVGIGTDKKTLDQIEKSKNEILFSDPNIKEKSEELILNELENIDDKKDVEISIKKFIEWIKNGKLEIKA